MADSFFGFESSLPNLDDEGGGASEDEYDALNDETFGQADGLDWETCHEQVSEQIESSRRERSSLDNSHDQLEASLSQLVLDETDAPHSSTLNNSTSSVWHHDPPPPTVPFVPTPMSVLKNVCTVEQLERQMRQNQYNQNMQQQQQQQQHNQNFFQPRFPPVILQRPPGLQAPVPLPFAPQQPMLNNSQLSKNMAPNQMGQMPNQMPQMPNQMGQMQNQMGQMQNQMGQMQNQMGKMPNQMGQMQNQMNQNIGQLSQMGNQHNQFGQMNHQMGQPNNHIGPPNNQIGQINNQIGQHNNQMGQHNNQMVQHNNQMGQMGPVNNQMTQMTNTMGPIGNQINPNVNQFIQNANQMNNQFQNPNQNAPMMQMNMGPNQMGPNQMGQGQMPPNGNGPFGPNMNQFQHLMGQPRMMGPPPGLNMPPRQNFNQNINQLNSNFLQQQSKPTDIPQSQSQSQSLNQSFNQNNNQSMKQSPPKTNQKGQKNRIVYNSNQKPQNLTSQNLVQLIQNTHPMLQPFNSLLNNANHHPLLNRNGMFAQNNQVYNNNNRQNNGGYSNNNNSVNNRHLQNGGDMSPIEMRMEDEYAGLMTQREKQWLINIQLLQLNSGTPYMDDYYYTVFLERKSRKEKECVKEAHKANQQNHPFYSGNVKSESSQRERHNSQRHNSQSEELTPRTYVPLQFENSLGKLQCGSVTAPRKIIDAEVVASETGVTSLRASRAPSVASTALEAPREVKRTKQLLLDIEALHLILLRLEELNDPLAISNALLLKEREEKAKQAAAAAALEDAANEAYDEETNAFLRNIECLHRKHKSEPAKTEVIDKRQVVSLTVSQNPTLTAKNLLDENKEELVNKMFAGLLHEDRLQHIVMVRKGRSLLCRFLSLLSPSEARTRSIWSRVLRSLPHFHTHHLLPKMHHHAHRYVQNTVGWNTVLEWCSLLGEAFDPARTPYALSSPLTLSIVCSLLEKATSLVNTTEATPQERQWTKFLRTFARALKNTTLTIARPMKPLEESIVTYHIKHVESRSVIEILPRGRTTADLADLSKTDFSELLIKHLC